MGHVFSNRKEVEDHVQEQVWLYCLWIGAVCNGSREGCKNIILLNSGTMLDLESDIAFLLSMLMCNEPSSLRTISLSKTVNLSPDLFLSRA